MKLMMSDFLAARYVADDASCFSHLRMYLMMSDFLPSGYVAVADDISLSHY